MLLVFSLSFVKLCDPYERFFMLLKSRSRAHHPNMHYSYTQGRRKNLLPFRSTHKCSTHSLGVNKNMLDRFSIHQINALSSCCYLSKVLLQKRGMGMQKELRKNEQVSEISKTMGTQMPA